MKRWVACALGLLACSTEPRVERGQRVVVRVERGSALDLAKLGWEPRAAVRSVRAENDQVTLELDPELHTGLLALSTPDSCRANLDLSRPIGTETSIELRPWLEVDVTDRAEVGYASPFVVTLTPGCPEAAAGNVTWKVAAGARVELHAEQDGFVLRGLTQKWSELHPGPLPWGIVPVSPRTQGQTTLEATWRGAGREVRVELQIAAAARATGLPSVVLGQRLVLGGSGWHVRESARGGRASVSGTEPQTFRPDARGRWVLEDDAGRSLSLVAGRHDETPLDCGRADCHPSEAKAATQSRMTSTLRRALTADGARWDTRCAIACHATGEPGLADGGLSDVLAAFGLPVGLEPGPGAWDALPRAARRVGGVTCTACHGPGAIPEPSASWAILRADVCAVCHDAPPRYGHVAAWSRSTMARADRDPVTRTDPTCRGCHTTAGFLERQGLRKRDPNAPDVEMGIACATCHAPHGPTIGRALVRNVPLTEGVALPASAAPSRVCIACHASPSDAAPASAATLIFGSAPGTAAPHAEVIDGCMGCHGRGAELGHGHDFRVAPTTCTPCHEGGIPKPPPGPPLAERARALLGRLGMSVGDAPAHARPRPLPSNLRRAEAIRNALLVLEDPAAESHNGPYARWLLDEAERLLAPP